jgi:hypothetical protein
MGMFDNIIVKKKLPLPKELKDLDINWKEYTFQTKNLENCLLDYYIDRNGELWEKIVERKYIYYTEEEKKKLKPKSWDLFKDVIETAKDPKKINYHGTINFYTYEELNKDEDFWLEYEGYFIYGKLDKVEIKKFYIEETRKKSLKEWEESYKKQQQRPWNRFKHYASYIGWRWCWKKISTCLHRLSRGLSNLQILISKYML